MAERDWTIDDVATRFAEGARTARSLPGACVQGHFNLWPPFVREPWETYPDEEHVCHRLPPSPQAIERMMETMRWVQWLAVEDRHLVWMRAKDIPWNRIARRFSCNRVTAWRRWQRALSTVVSRLQNAPAGGVCNSCQNLPKTLS